MNWSWPKDTDVRNNEAVTRLINFSSIAHLFASLMAMRNAVIPYTLSGLLELDVLGIRGEQHAIT
jgi:hypothetical protein